MKTLAQIHARTIDCGGCRLWQGSTNEKGHPKLHNKSARRAVWAAVNGPIPDGMLVTVNCGRAGCLEPKHLELTTKSKASQISNARPAVMLKRRAMSAATNRLLLGKITLAIAAEIKCSDKTGVEWAKELKVSPSLISKVRRGKSWVDYSSPWAGLGAR